MACLVMMDQLVSRNTARYDNSFYSIGNNNNNNNSIVWVNNTIKVFSSVEMLEIKLYWIKENLGQN